MVLSRNRLGDGLFSATVTATTKGQLPEPRNGMEYRKGLFPFAAARCVASTPRNATRSRNGNTA